MLAISVIICTHNPRLSYLRRCIEALKAQTLAKAEWELLIVDNASDRPIRDAIDLDWHSDARIIREENVGLVHARSRGISESHADLLVFLDDDNVLNPDYLRKALEIAGRHSMLGAWGGQITPEYEVPPTEEVKPYLELLGIRKLARDTWGNDPRWGHLPMGSGMCVRRVVAQRYCREILTNPLHLAVGHAGSRRSCHADTDLAVTSFDVDLGIGLFRSLMLTHLIPAGRLNEDYLLRLAENSAAALLVFKHVRGLKIEPPAQGRRWIIEKLAYWAGTTVQRKLAIARLRGEQAGRDMISDLAKRNLKTTESAKKSLMTPDLEPMAVKQLS